MNDRVFNFAAGPGVLTDEVLLRAQKEMLNYDGSGMSVMEMSHRSASFQKIFDHTKHQFRKVMNIPDNYEILFLQGGASSQFSMVPLNLLKNGMADYALTGNFSAIAYREAMKYGKVNCSYDGGETGYSHIPMQNELDLHPGTSYFHFCSNNTIYGTEWNYVPDTHGVPIVCDMSSNICTRPINISQYGLIYAGAQKNLAPAGVTVVIIRKDLAGKQMEQTPLMMNYETMIEKDSMYNTPPCWCIYMLGLTIDWIEETGGVMEMEKRNSYKARMLYDVIDSSSLYNGHAEKSSRSRMNVTFTTGSKEMDTLFIKKAEDCGLYNLKGHRLTGGIRASIYNAMKVEGVEKLCAFMKDFERIHG